MLSSAWLHDRSWSVTCGNAKGRRDRAGPSSSLREVARGGVEPPTFRFSVGRSYQLSYGASKHKAYCLYCRTPNGIRTRAAAVKGRSPRPLDDEGAATAPQTSRTRRGLRQHRGKQPRTSKRIPGGARLRSG